MAIDAKIEIDTALLRTLHRIHRQRNDLKNQLERGPRQVKAGQAMVDKAQAGLDAATETLKKAKVASDEKQLQLSSREARIEELKAKLNTAGSNREFSTLKEQIAADQQANSVLSDEILEGLEQLDQLAVELKDAEVEHKKQLSEQQQRIAHVDAKQTDLQSELERVEAELVETEKQIPGAVKADYKRLTDSKGEEALAPIDDESCGGCYQTLTTQFVDMLRLSKLVRCPNCNAFLYLAEDRKVT